jgi:hypothetical protein
MIERLVFACAGVWLAHGARADTASVERKPLAIKSYVDFGQVVKGSNLQNASGGPIEALPVQRTGISLVQEATVEDRLEIKIGVGGLFWYSWNAQQGAPHTQVVRFGPGISTAHANFKFGDLEKPWMTAQFGFFTHKYNPDAVNLGEYLFRSTAYPALVYTGGWNFIASASARLTGVRLAFSHFGGVFTHDLMAYFETEFYPQNSISGAWLGTFKAGALELGTGVAVQHMIPMKPSRLTPKDPLSTYVKLPFFPAVAPDSGLVSIDNGPLERRPLHRDHGGGPIEGIEAELRSMRAENPSLPGDTILPYLAVTNGVDTLYRQTESQPIPEGYAYLYPRVREHFTFRGIKAMARASLDFKILFGLGGLGPEDLKVFAEMAILGVQNYPFYYDDISQRMPLMVGLNLPAFGWLDVLCVQAETRRFDFLDSEEKSFQDNLPVYLVPRDQNGQNPYLHGFEIENRKENDWKWTVYARKSLFRGLKLYAQFASDHARLQDFQAVKTFQPVLNSPKEWYYLLRVEFGI